MPFGYATSPVSTEGASSRARDAPEAKAEPGEELSASSQAGATIAMMAATIGYPSALAYSPPLLLAGRHGFRMPRPYPLFSARTTGTPYGSPDLRRLRAGRCRVMYEIKGDVVSIWHIARGKPAADLPMTLRPGISADQGYPTKISPLLPGPPYASIADCACGATTIRDRRDEWIKAGIFAELKTIARESYDRIVGLVLQELAVDGCIAKAPGGGECAGRSPVDRGKLGMKRSLMVEGRGIPLGRVLAPANRHDSPLLAPTLDKLDVIGQLPDDITIHLDAGYDSQKTRDELAGRGMTGEIARKGVALQRTLSVSITRSRCLRQSNPGLGPITLTTPQISIPMSIASMPGRIVPARRAPSISSAMTAITSSCSAGASVSACPAVLASAY